MAIPVFQSSFRYFYPRPPRGGRPAVQPRTPPPSMNFYPRPPRGGRHDPDSDFFDKYQFLSTPSARRATRASFTEMTHFNISIHALREEGDSACAIPARQSRNFYPRPPRGGRRHGGPAAGQRCAISIHALREEGDLLFWRRCRYRRNFYPRPPRGEIFARQNNLRVVWRFLSTPSARRATAHGKDPQEQQQDFYPRPPRGGRHGDSSRKIRASYISIHALREEGDWAGVMSLIFKS